MMATLRTWMRQVGGALIACLLVALVVAPSIDSAICANDSERSSSVSGTASDQGASDPNVFDQGVSGRGVDIAHQKSNGDDGGADVCIHGHCHHASPVISGDGARGSVRQPLASHTSPRNLRFPPSSAQGRLEEPPRA
ncbi:hypothetical protein CC_2720 [Caulobacter vibrioides CB15]|uniref:Uncharacterized protein n=2 Tax=Caulobacter vibrioides TaxID=155892 RepID=Q9A4V5_CAUVC|nr:hypothetical protein CC_2720 [Caulobacter vibrioides CB15]